MVSLEAGKPSLSNVSNVLDGLICRFSPEEQSIYRRRAAIEKLIAEFQTNPGESLGKLKSAYSTLTHFRTIKSSDKTPPSPHLVELFENQAVAYLIYQLQKRSSEDGKEIKIRPDQIDGIIALLNKNHLQAKTGYGKSSFVLPIASIVLSLSENSRIAIVAPSPELKSELLDSIKKIAALLPSFLQLKIYEYIKDGGVKRDSTKKDQNLQEQEFLTLAQNIIQTPKEKPITLPQNINNQQRRRYFLSWFHYPNFFKNVSDQAVVNRPPANNPSLTVFEENDAVFDSLYHQEEKDRFSWVFFDDAHVPHSRNTVYYITEASALITPATVEEFLIKRFFAQFLKEAVESEGLFVQGENGAWWFKNQSAQNQVDYLLKNIFNDRSKAKSYLDKAVCFFSQKLNIPPQAVEDWIRGWFEKRKPRFFVDLTSEILLGLSKAKSIKEGIHYFKSDQKSTLTVRDYFMGLALPTHHFNPEDVLGIQALSDALNFADYYEVSKNSCSFEGWVNNLLKGRFIGLTNNLFTPRIDQPKHFQKTGLAKFLERSTGHPAFFAGEKPVSFIPPPVVTSTTTDLNNDFINNLSADQRPTIVFCFNENEASAIQEAIKKSLPDRKVFIASASIDETEARKIYAKFVESDQPILISTGRVGVGVDLKKTSGEFPDLKIVIYGVPFTSDQIFQAMGRRRLPSKNPSADFVWFLSKNQLRDYPPFQYQYSNEDDQKKFFEKLGKNPISALAGLIEFSEEMSHDRDDFLVSFDTAYQTALSEFEKKARAEALLKYKKVEKGLTLSEDEIRVLDSFAFHLLGKDLKNLFADFIGAPSGLYWILHQQMPLTGAGSLGAAIVDSLRLYFSNPENFDHWIEARSDLFKYLIKEIILSQLYSSSDYEKMKTAKNLRFARSLWLPANVTTDKITDDGLFYYDNESGFFYRVYKKNGQVFLLSDATTGQPLPIEKNYIVTSIFDGHPDINGQITAIFENADN